MHGTVGMFAVCCAWGTRQSGHVCRVPRMWLTANIFFFAFSSFSRFLFFLEKTFADGWAWHTTNFAVCLKSGTRQSRC
jgi:hypothetical protein